MKNMSIHEIEALTISDMKAAVANRDAELIQIKDHNCYFVEFDGYFGFSVLVFKNGRHISHADDYQLHHRGKSKDELKAYYIEKMNHILFTEYELLGGIADYDEFKRKDNYLRNYWIMQFEHHSIFFTGEASSEYLRAKREGFFVKASFCWVTDKKISDRSTELLDNIEKEYQEMSKSDDFFREMISDELYNHEAGITCSSREALAALGVRYSDLSPVKKRIVDEELNKCIEFCM